MSDDVRLQPFLHALTTVLAAPTQVLSRADGDIVDGAHGVLHADVRVLSSVRLTVGGHAPEHIATTAESSVARFTSLLRRVRTGVTGPDPTLRLDRTREVSPGNVGERLIISSVGDSPVETEIMIEIASDLITIELIKSGISGPAIDLPAPDGQTLRWGDDQVEAVLSASGATITHRQAQDGGEPASARIVWPVTVPAHGFTGVSWSLAVSDAGGAVAPAQGPGLPVDDLASALSVRALAPGTNDPRLESWLRQSLGDLNALRMTRTGFPAEPFFAAGSPWYLTLFGRDSLLAARLVLPVDHDHAVGTLRTLARLQGTETDTDIAEAPGKIMHELRRASMSADGPYLPPLYYGTIDATPLWVCLLHDAWKAGVDETIIAELVPTMIKCLDWLVTYADSDGDGFIEYVDESGRGLANQGWKDSSDSVRFADGTIATGPVALCEVQGYAYEAAMSAAALLDHFGQPGGDRFRSWATALADRFRAAFWVERDGRRYPALALDGAKNAVDSVTSNIGHLLGTGLLSAEEERLVAERLAAPDMDSGLGLRTMSNEAGGYSPLSYHCGSVWPHDTAVVIAGMVRAGLVEHARGLVAGLLRASAHFDGRFPELWSGEGIAGVPYPAACRPQAWSAAAVVPVVSALETLR